jgi:hypothetical protein
LRAPNRARRLDKLEALSPSKGKRAGLPKLALTISDRQQVLFAIACLV